MHIIIDLEVYKNYFLCGAYHIEKGTYEAFGPERMGGFGEWLRRYRPTLVTFNGLHYDLRLLSYAIANPKNPELVKELKVFSDWIIEQPKNHPYAGLFEHFRWWNLTPHIDLKQMLGGRTCPSLKKLACRLNLPEVEALPIDPAKVLTEAEKQQIKTYNRLDLLNTRHLWDAVQDRLALRESLSKSYKLDLRSSSDAQIAEKVLCKLATANPVEFDTSYSRPLKDILKPIEFAGPEIQAFYGEMLASTAVRFQRVYDKIKGRLTYSKAFERQGKTFKSYKLSTSPPVEFAFGGLHSIHGKASSGEGAYDVDVASFYPNLILRYKIYPESAGEKFVDAYGRLLDRRLKAKEAGRQVEADSLKIVLNAAFGKFNEYYSKLRDPLCGAAVCLLGQAAILKLVDLCHQAGVEVLLVNTDGIVTRQDPSAVVGRWVDEFNMPLEIKPVAKFFVKDSNNHILYYDGGKKKIKGAAFAYEPSLSKQTNFPVVQKAVVANLMEGTPLEETIETCDNVYSFMGVYAKGSTILRLKAATSPEDDGEEMPSLVRFYTGSSGRAMYRQNAKGWTRIADSEDFVTANKVGAFPADLNFNRYVERAKTKLERIKK